ncbi:hypothetical protein [Rhodococcus tukisamuensis]|uniref:Uncharacterized protein n=1 Tax=Rhodococcus tukisamuensis TaxID=168276 RepID=A0A1G7B789_9NOCA|nr:hypothetical protein [Rhodococcus tukisamuensis]SDE22873.1 hypothetical protein SAMN05444580_112106 [Rhodococcus tukisamuensis]
MSNPDAYTDTDLAEYKAELNAIVTDPNLTFEEKLDAISDAAGEEFDDIVNAHDATATAPEETPVTEPTSTVYDKLDAIDATIEDLSSIGPDAPAGSDVVGDPATASYNTATAPTSEPVPAADTTAAPAEVPAEAPSEVNEAIGVNGNVDYFSPRDVDRDGDVDIAHSRVDGVDTITHYADDGAITLVEQDTDFNGTYETAASVRADGTVRTAEDSDDDGDVDLVTYYDPATRQPERQDAIDGARITDSKFDTDGDAQPDVHLVDSDGDGRFDSVAVDSDADGIVNETLVDTDGDGAFDLISSDDDNDGTQESYLTSAENGVGSLGDISTYESLIPADDSYHTQAGTGAYEPPTVDEIPGDLA